MYSPALLDEDTAGGAARKRRCSERWLNAMSCLHALIRPSGVRPPGPMSSGLIRSFSVPTSPRPGESLCGPLVSKEPFQAGMRWP
jgi:hypothetical protein